MHRQEEALKAIREAVGLYQLLATSSPDASHAGSLTALSSQLSHLGHREEALNAIKESVELFQPLAMAYPDTFNSSLAISLVHLARGLAELGH